MTKRMISIAPPRFLQSLMASLGILALAASSQAQTTAQASAQPRPQPTSQRILFAGLRSVAHQGQFNSVRSAANGNLYLLLDQKDGVRVLLTDPAATNILAEAQLGAKGDIGIALALDPAGNVYVTGTSTSTALTGTPGTSFPNRADPSTNTFLAGFDAALNPLFVTFGGTGRMAATAVAATADAVFLTGSLFGNALPVTSAGVQQAPAPGSFQNGFVERFSPTGTLIYATYLTGAAGDTAPSGIAADASDSAYVTGFTTAPGFPTVAAIVPRIPGSLSGATTGTASGFLTRFTPAGDGLTFSTFIPGSGLTSIALDPATSTLLLSGNVDLGRFPITIVSSPLVNTAYQTLLRLPLDGSSVTSGTVLAPGTQSFVTPAPNGSAWVDGLLTLPVLPFTPVSDIGNAFAVHINAQSVIDQTARFGGLPTSNPGFASAPVTLTSLAVDPSGNPIVAGSLTPTASSALLAAETFDFPLVNTPTPALPSTVRDAVLPAGSCTGSQCAGSAAFLSRLAPTPGLAALALSTDAAPNATLRNLSTAAATGLQINATGFTVATNCPPTLASGAECTIALTSTAPAPGSLTVTSSNAAPQTAQIPTTILIPDAIAISPKELDFGIQTPSQSSQPSSSRTFTVTNLTQQSQTFTSTLAGTRRTPYTFTEASSDCTTTGPSTRLLAPNSSCSITLTFIPSSSSVDDGPVTAEWAIGTHNIILLTAFTQAAPLSLSAARVDFGTDFAGGLRTPRFLYVSNNSDAPVPHTPVALPASSPFNIIDRCPTTLEPHSVCQIQFTYESLRTPPSVDSTTLALDQDLAVQITGQTLPQPGVNGSTVNPNLTLTPDSLAFANPVIVTSISSATQTATIRNTGVSAFPLTLALTGDFTQTTNCPDLLPGGASCTVVISFAPSAPGPRSGLLAVTAGTNTSPAYVTLSASASPILAPNNGILDLGSIFLGQPVVQYFKITQPFTRFTASVPSPDFTVALVEDSGRGHGIVPSTAFASTASGTCIDCFLAVQFKPTSPGPRTVTLSLTSDPAGNPYLLSLTGSGLPLTGVMLLPPAQDFGPIPVNSTSAPTLFTLINLVDPPSSIAFLAATVSGDFALSATPTGGAACTGTLAPAASCFLQVVFAPTATGQRTGTLTVQTSAGTVTSSLSAFGSPDPGLSLSPAALIFNNVPGSSATLQTVTLKNTSTLPESIGTPTSSSPAFSPTSNCSTLAPGASCTLTLTFTPTSAPVTGSLQVPFTANPSGTPLTTTLTVPLTGNFTAEETGLQIIPAQASFGPAAAATLGLTRQFTINNLTATALTVTIAIPRHFALVTPPCAALAPFASCNFAVTFAPLTNGDITGTLFAQASTTGPNGNPTGTIDAIAYLEGFGQSLNTLTLTGDILPGSHRLDFGQVPSGQTVQKIVTLTNTATGPRAAPLNIRRLTSEFPFLSTSTCSTPLAVNQSCTVTLTYTSVNQVGPGTTSPQTHPDAGTLIIESDAQSSPDLLDLAAISSPTVVATPSNAAPLVTLAASQSSLSFSPPGVRVGDLSAPQTLTLANTGTLTLHLGGLHTTPDFTVSSSCATLIPGASCLLTVSFSPQTPGLHLSALEISSDATTSLEFISLFGVAEPAFLSLTPSAFDFGTVQVGAAATLPLQIANIGSTPAVFKSITATNDFSVSLGTCPAPGGALAPGASCTAQVTFTPTVGGTRTGTVSVATSLTALPLTAALTGNATQSHLQITPSALNFGSIALGVSANLTLTLANTGTAPLTAIVLAVTGDYAVTVPCTLSTLAPGRSCAVTVTFGPTALGPRNGVLTVTTADTSTIVPLTGNGVQNGSFTLTINGGPTASASVRSGRPASFALSLTPINTFTGAVALTCTPIALAPDATCSLLPSTLNLTGSTPQAASVLLETVTSVNTAALLPPTLGLNASTLFLSFLAPAFLFLWRSRQPRGPLHRLPQTLLCALCALTLANFALGCGSGGDPHLRYTPPGSYQYQVTASSTTGIQITQTVTLSLTVTPR